MNVVIKKKRGLYKQFINGINDDDMMTEIIKELMTIQKMDEVKSEQRLSWSRRGEAQWT